MTHAGAFALQERASKAQGRFLPSRKTEEVETGLQILPLNCFPPPSPLPCWVRVNLLGNPFRLLFFGSAIFWSAMGEFVQAQTTNIPIQRAYLKASNAEALDYFGTSVAISGDTIVVGTGGNYSGLSEAGED